MGGKKMKQLLRELTAAEESDECLFNGGKGDSHSGATCKYHPIVKTILVDIKEQSRLKWKVLLGIIPVFFGLLALSGVFYTVSSDKVVNELHRIRYELIQNQETMKKQIDVNTIKVAEYGAVLIRVEKDIEKLSKVK